MSTNSDEGLVSMPSDFFSDDSSFYGGDELKAVYERKAFDFNPREFLEIQKWNLRCIRAQELASPEPEPHGQKRKREEAVDLKTRKKKAATDDKKTVVKGETSLDSIKNPDPMDVDSKPSHSVPFNPYEGDEMAKQLDETLDDFLSRLPPSSTKVESGPWIWIANPLSTRRDTSSDVAGFKQAGFNLLEEFNQRKRKLKDLHPTKATATITRMLKPDREWLESSIVTLAKSKQVTCGKWMLFPLPHRVDDVWRTVARATLEGKLGNSAKVATDDDKSGGGEKPERLVCIYTDDFSDTEDVKRVLCQMQSLNLVRGEAEAQPIYYKCDAYTYLDILSGNDYKLKASMYCSRDLFEEMARQKEKEKKK